MTNSQSLLDTTDTDYSESEAFSSLQISGQVKSPPMSPPNRSEGMVMRIETTRAPVPSQPEVVLSDGKYQSIYFTLTSTQGRRKHKMTQTLHFNWLSMWSSERSLPLSFSNSYFLLLLYSCLMDVQLWRQVVEAHSCPSNRILPYKSLI